MYMSTLSSYLQFKLMPDLTSFKNIHTLHSLHTLHTLHSPHNTRYVINLSCNTCLSPCLSPASVN